MCLCHQKLLFQNLKVQWGQCASTEKQCIMVKVQVSSWNMAGKEILEDDSYYYTVNSVKSFDAQATAASSASGLLFWGWGHLTSSKMFKTWIKSKLWCKCSVALHLSHSNDCEWHHEISLNLSSWFIPLSCICCFEHYTWPFNLIILVIKSFCMFQYIYRQQSNLIEAVIVCHQDL